MAYYIGADLGTSALKLLLVDDRGRGVSSVSKSYPIAYPQPGWSEQNPEDWWQALKEGIPELTDGIDKSRVAGIGVAGQMHGLVILDDGDRVIRPAILWNDGRTAAETAYLNETIGTEKLAAYTDNMAFAGFTAPKLLWLKAHEPENFAKIRKVMLPKDYINYRLTGRHTTDYSDAAGMLLLDVQHKCWSQDMLDIVDIREEQMPKLLESYVKAGTLTEKSAVDLGLFPGVTVAAGAGDNAAAAVGTGTVGNGKCNISLGTSGTVFACADAYAPLKNHAIHYFCHADGGYHSMGCILSAASCNKWFCEDVLGTADYAGLQKAITPAMLGHNDVYFLPYLMGERSPLNDVDARGVFIGLRPDTGRTAMVQAVLEGVAFAIRDNVDIIRQSGTTIERSSLCGGGAKSPLWRQILADVLAMPIDIPTVEEGPAYGGALLAMVCCGRFATVADCAAAFTGVSETVFPDPAAAAAYEERYQKYKAIYPALKPIYKILK